MAASGHAQRRAFTPWRGPATLDGVLRSDWSRRPTLPVSVAGARSVGKHFTARRTARSSLSERLRVKLARQETFDLSALGEREFVVEIRTEELVTHNCHQIKST